MFAVPWYIVLLQLVILKLYCALLLLKSSCLLAVKVINMHIFNSVSCLYLLFNMWFDSILFYLLLHSLWHFTEYSSDWQSIKKRYVIFFCIWKWNSVRAYKQNKYFKDEMLCRSSSEHILRLRLSLRCSSSVNICRLRWIYCPHKSVNIWRLYISPLSY